MGADRRSTQNRARDSCMAGGAKRRAQISPARPDPRRGSGSGVLDPAHREAVPPDINPFPAGWTRRAARDQL
jgi:hypothetical protein